MKGRQRIGLLTGLVTSLGLAILAACSHDSSPNSPAAAKFSMVVMPDQQIGFVDSVKCRYQRVTLTITASGGSGAVTYSMAAQPSGSAFSPSTGVFSWTPTIADFGRHTVIFTARAGNETAADTVVLSVKAPVLPADSGFQFVTPNGGETYHYGDTIFCTWLQAVPMTINAEMGVSSNGGRTFCNFFASEAEWPKWSRDMDSTTSKYFRNIDARSAVGVYKMALIDRNPLDCPVTFAGSQMKLEVFDEYAMCACRDQTDSVFTIIK